MNADRLSAQLLAGTAGRSVVEVVDRLLAVQAQDPRGMRLAIRARSRGLTAGEVDRSLTVDRSLVVSWLNRGTLHLVRSEDYWWLHDLTTPQLVTGNARRLVQEGVSAAAAERGVAEIEQALEEAGPLRRDELRRRFVSAGVPVAGQALIHILFLAALRGLVVRGPVVGGEQAFALVRDWLGERPPPLPRGEALARLASRYLAGHAPADERDLARWAGIPVRDARRALDAADATALPPARRVGRMPSRLLGAFDPVLLGWVTRDWVLDGHAGVVTNNGIFRPIAVVAGRAVATWSMPGGQVQLAPFEPLGAAVERALTRDAADVRRFLAVTSTLDGDDDESSGVRDRVRAVIGPCPACCRRSP